MRSSSQLGLIQSVYEANFNPFLILLRYVATWDASSIANGNWAGISFCITPASNLNQVDWKRSDFQAHVLTEKAQSFRRWNS
jgi:hypothetical protein